MTSAAPLDPLLVAAFEDLVVGYDKRTGATLWQFMVQSKKPRTGSPRPRPLRAVVRHGRVFVLAGCGHKSTTFAELAVLDGARGTLLWSQRIDRGAPSFAATLAIDEHLAIVCHHDLVIAFSVPNGQILWQRASEHPAPRFLVPIPQLADAHQICVPVM